MRAAREKGKLERNESRNAGIAGIFFIG